MEKEREIHDDGQGSNSKAIPLKNTLSAARPDHEFLLHTLEQNLLSGEKPKVATKPAHIRFIFCKGLIDKALK